MELRILQALTWRLSTPTALAFLRHFMAIIPPVLLDENMREEIFDLAKFQAEVALGDYKYVTVNKSTIAYSSLMNALEAVHHASSRRIGWFLSEAAHIDRDSIYTTQIQQSLAHDHADHASLKGSPVSAGYKHTINQRNSRSNKKHSNCASPTGYHSPRTVCKTS